MSQEKKLILQKIYEGICEDLELAEAVKIDIYRIRVYLNDLDQLGYIKQKKCVTFNLGGDEKYLVTAITPEGRLALKGDLPLDRVSENKFHPQVNNIFNAKVETVQSGSFRAIENKSYKEAVNMVDDEQYFLEQSRKRFIVLKAIYTDSKGDKDKVTGTNYICKTVGICSEELLHILEFLKDKGLIKPMGSLYSMYGGEAYVTITHAGMYEVENAIKEAYESTKNFPAQQVFQNTFNAPVGGLQQAGQYNNLNVVQNIENNEIPLTGEALEELQRFIDTLTKDKPDNLSQSQALQAAGILLELKEASENQDKNGQIEAVSKWKQWLNKLPEKSLKALSITADLVSLALPLAKILGLPVP